MKLHLALGLAILLGSKSSVCGVEPKRISIDDLQPGGIEIIGKLRVPLGKVATIEGVAISQSAKGHENGPSLQVQRIDGRAIQEDIKIRIAPLYSVKWGSGPIGEGDGIALPELEMGKTYEMAGYETGEFRGTPLEAANMANVPWLQQWIGHTFWTRFTVIKASVIEPIVQQPKLAATEKALIEGVAQTVDGNQTVVGKDWTVLVARDRRWPANFEGKGVQVYGRYKAENDGKIFGLIDGETHLVDLKEQVGGRVLLAGITVGKFDQWNLYYSALEGRRNELVFIYRGEKIYVENLDKLPEWSAERLRTPILIEGTLGREKLPDLNQFSVTGEANLKEQYVVRVTAWRPLSKRIGVAERGTPNKPALPKERK